MFILTADNGMGWGSNRWARKIAPYTAPVTLHISWPAVIQEKSTNSTLVSNIDVAPTLCELAGCVMGPFPNGFGVDGESFAGILDARFTSRPTRDSIILEGGGDGVPAFRALLTGANHRSGRWLFIRYLSTGERELYNMAGGPCNTWAPGKTGDPCMLQNVSGQRPTLRKTLAAELAAEW
jgi:hypothetical protein